MKTGETVKTVKVKQTKKKAKKKTFRKTVKKLKKGRYRIKVRAFNNVGGKVYYGKWSKSRKVRVK